MAIDKDMGRDMDTDLEVNLDGQSGDKDSVVEYEVKEDRDMDFDLTMEMEMNPVFLLMHSIEVKYGLCHSSNVIHCHGMKLVRKTRC